MSDAQSPIRWGIVGLGWVAADFVVPAMVNPGPAPAPVTNVQVNMHRGMRERDVLVAAERAARRSGGLYRRSRRLGPSTAPRRR